VDQADAAALVAVRRELVVQFCGVLDGEVESVEDPVDAEGERKVGFAAVEVVLECVQVFEGTARADT
jgi:hypothetical protein